MPSELLLCLILNSISLFAHAAPSAGTACFLSSQHAKLQQCHRSSFTLLRPQSILPAENADTLWLGCPVGALRVWAVSGSFLSFQSLAEEKRSIFGGMTKSFHFLIFSCCPRLCHSTSHFFLQSLSYWHPTNPSKPSLNAVFFWPGVVWQASQVSTICQHTFLPRHRALPRMYILAYLKIDGR